MDFSLLHPAGSAEKYKTLTPQAINDLSIDYLCESLTDNAFERGSIRNLMTNITTDENVIRYRCDIFNDLYKNPQLRIDLAELLAKLSDLRELEKFKKDSDTSDLWALINRLREIDGYVDCITDIKHSLEKFDITSEGLLELKKIVTDIHDNSGFPEIKKDIAEALAVARRIKSITIGVNLDDLLRPTKAGIICVNDFYISHSGILRNFMGHISSGDELNSDKGFASMKSFHQQNPSPGKIGFAMPVVGAQNDVSVITSDTATGGDPLSQNLSKTMTAIVKKIVKTIQGTLHKYISISGFSLVSLVPEIIFYIRWAALIDKLMENGTVLCKPEVLPIEERALYTEDIYNIKLAVKSLGADKVDIVGNDFEFSDNARIYIMTGPNRGGKTTFTQAIGLGFLLAQNGIYVPAKSFRFSPCDNIYTHFPADENDTVDLGRLGEESKRIAEIFRIATDKSLLLFNESLATTNVSEGLYIAKDVVKAMRYIGTRTIFNTHMHELAHNLDILNGSIDGESKVESLVTGVDHGKRSYKVSIAPPQGVSYARDIAVKYGVTFEQIKETLDDRHDKS
ncbi:MAG: DNA mismatch repair protein [Clostridia bacterium]|nr:DNA mismatch repair protein [Clostridia bacterium]